VTSRRSALALAALVGGGGAAGLAALGRRDAAAVRADPASRMLLGDRSLPGTFTTVRSADGTALRVLRAGPVEAPVVVLSHGWTCSLEYWTPQIRALVEGYRVIAYDQRGHAGSGQPGELGFTPEALAADLDAVLDAAPDGATGDGRRAVVVGHSMGAMSVVAWAGQHADRVEERLAAALLASTGMHDLVDDAVLLPLPKGWRRVRALAGRLVLQTPAPIGRPSPLSHRAIRHIALSSAASPAQVAFCERIILGCPRRVRAGWGTALSRLDLRDAVRRLRVPTVVLVGSVDRLTPPRHARDLAASLPRLERLVELEGVGHMSTVEAADRATAEIRRLADTYASRS
jgi:pimeloyl-ACP methyl ester carboxylesterase